MQQTETTDRTATIELEGLSLEQKVGQLFVAGFDGTTPPESFKSLITDCHLGGVIYFSRNVETPEQLRSLSNDLQSLVPEETPPLLTTIDQEGGRVARVSWGTEIPSAMALGAAGDADLSRRAGEAVGQELRTLGVDMNLAPVLDVNNNPENPVIGVRSFSETPDSVAGLGTAFASGLQSADVIACGKHFPGHGDTAVDSHHALPVIDHDRNRLNEVELPPFESAIDSGLRSVMITHVAFPTITERAETPATLSQSVVTGLLRDELGFDGLVITDCMEMDAISDSIGTVEGAVQAVEAGCDLIAVSHTPAKQRAAIDAVIDAVESGRLSEEQITESVRRILNAKTEFSVGQVGEQSDWEAAAEVCQSVRQTIAERGATVVRDETNTLPLTTTQEYQLIEFHTGRGSPAEETREKNSRLFDALETEEIDVDSYTLTADDEVPALDDGVKTIVCTSTVAAHLWQADVVNHLLEKGHDPIVIAVQSPYDLTQFDSVSTYLTTYDDTAPSYAAIAKILAGTHNPTGTLPVTIPGEQNSN
ncbi:beta-N-acetylhexosaminidase [Haloprofundus marisrubri]|uniref:beta-N-acetylhexosaminidase n=1 Tax=Haloprofundus marisrubri TaxID=1514971 RepID=UPI0009E47D3C|nr:beta-N-acetylhexosaminidase [Haloprofundus marisrubri]